MVSIRRFSVQFAWLTAFLAAVFLVSVILHRIIPERADSTAEPVIRHIPPEEWLDFAVVHPPTNRGWVAVPPSSEGAYPAAFDSSRTVNYRPESCRECHADLVEEFGKTAHARTMALPSLESILGSFRPTANRLETSLPGFSFQMTEKDGQFLQEVHMERPLAPLVLSFPIAFVIGSGNHGQGFLHWSGDQLCAMHVSYFTEFDRWTNSPGSYLDGTGDFARPVSTRCLDCHATGFRHVAGSINRYDRSNWILGVTCVRCHGPTGEHVEHHRSHREEAEPQFIANPSRLEREAANEVCAQCHSGPGDLLRTAFTYRPGERLKDYLDIDLTGEGQQNEDPHSANQLGRLMRSRCYQESPTLTCITCHDPHRHERGQTSVFSQRCQKCHAVEDCPTRKRHGSAIDQRCVECHMPSRRDVEVAARGPGDLLLPLLRDHLIAVRPEVDLREEATTANPADSGRAAEPLGRESKD